MSLARFACALAFLLFPLAAFTQDATPLRGIVVDAEQATIADAVVTITPSGSAARTLKTGADGTFATLIPAGHVSVKIEAPGFDTLITEGTADSDGLDLGTITLKVGAQVDITVETPHAIAEQQVKLEETQRVLGVFPDFYTSYIPNAAPLSSGQKAKLAGRTVIDPVTFIVAAASAGINQATNRPDEWGQDAAGYGQRYAAAYAGTLSSAILGGVVFPVILHQDPRYYMGSGTVGQRIRWAFKQSVEQKGDNGKWQPAYSNLLADVGSSLVITSIYPHSNTNWAATAGENAGIAVAGTAVGDLVEEFIVSRITKRKKAPAQATGTTP